MGHWTPVQPAHLSPERAASSWQARSWQARQTDHPEPGPLE
jgi:hypothetical protein